LKLRVIPPFWMTRWFRLLGLALLLAAALGGHRARVSAIERRNRELSVLRQKIEHSKEDERKRIARELHDEMGQMLVAAKINLQIAAAGSDESIRSRIDDSVLLVKRMIEQVRAIALDLRPPLLDEIGLLPALHGHVDDLARRSGIEITLGLDDGAAGARLPADVEIQVFRIVQESLTNVVRHSGAARATVAVRRERGALEIRVRDDRAQLMDRLGIHDVPGLVRLAVRAGLLSPEG
jgi:signal transduction histidine kinase